MINTTSVALLGVTGRMGKALLQSLAGFPDLKLLGALASGSSEWLGKDAATLASMPASGVLITSDLNHALSGAQVVVDFTLPQVTLNNVQACVERKLALVIGTTGHSAEQLAVIEQASKHISIVMAPNMSVGVNLLFKLAELAARALNDDYDIEIVEAHHRNKKDAPSGTALGIGEAAARGRRISLKDNADFTRHGETGARQRGHIGFSVIRGGDIVGDHTLLFAGPGEQIEISHRAYDRSGFARGALVAARWLKDRKSGLYSMQNVLGL
jgi:4-hydroxy-tetrahydrodipicolinate reductase